MLDFSYIPNVHFNLEPIIKYDIHFNFTLHNSIARFVDPLKYCVGNLLKLGNIIMNILTRENKNKVFYGTTLQR